MKFEIAPAAPGVTRVVLDGRADAAAIDLVEAGLTARLRDT